MKTTIKKYVFELTDKELGLVFNNNKNLAFEVEEEYIESEMMWVRDYLGVIKDSLIDWSIGAYNSNYIIIKDKDRFIRGVESLQQMYGFLGDKHSSTLKEVLEVADKIQELDYNDKNYCKYEEKFGEMIEHVKELVVSQFTSNLSFNVQDIKSYFIDIYSSYRMNEKDFYVDENYKLYKQVSYIKTY